MENLVIFQAYLDKMPFCIKTYDFEKGSYTCMFTRRIFYNKSWSVKEVTPQIII